MPAVQLSSSNDVAPPGCGSGDVCDDDEYYMDRMSEILDAFPKSGPPGHPCRVSSHVYIGNQDNADDLDLLPALGITYVLNMAGTRNFDATRSPYKPAVGVKSFLMIQAEDYDEYDIAAHFPDTNAFLDRARASGGQALVHCNLGVNRSGAVVAAYLMVCERRSLLRVVADLKAKRSLVIANVGFRRQLIRYARCRGFLDPVDNNDVIRRSKSPMMVSNGNRQLAADSTSRSTLFQTSPGVGNGSGLASSFDESSKAKNGAVHVALNGETTKNGYHRNGNVEILHQSNGFHTVATDDDNSDAITTGSTSSSRGGVVFVVGGGGTAARRCQNLVAAVRRERLINDVDAVIEKMQQQEEDDDDNGGSDAGGGYGHIKDASLTNGYHHHHRFELGGGSVVDGSSRLFDAADDRGDRSPIVFEHEISPEHGADVDHRCRQLLAEYASRPLPPTVSVYAADDNILTSSALDKPLSVYAPLSLSATSKTDYYRPSSSVETTSSISTSGIRSMQSWPTFAAVGGGAGGSVSGLYPPTTRITRPVSASSLRSGELEQLLNGTSSKYYPQRATTLSTAAARPRAGYDRHHHYVDSDEDEVGSFMAEADRRSAQIHGSASTGSFRSLALPRTSASSSCYRGGASIVLEQRRYSVPDHVSSTDLLPTYRSSSGHRALIGAGSGYSSAAAVIPSSSYRSSSCSRHHRYDSGAAKGLRSSSLARYRQLADMVDDDDIGGGRMALFDDDDGYIGGRLLLPPCGRLVPTRVTPPTSGYHRPIRQSPNGYFAV